uniref:Uncharacterized protein n=1 Tax=Nonomuraea gerenzanensis TaxID=93944 RepID=A0A1M4EEK1_9ACTN|nr:hypothetical protein BN4615_P6662 [Nonomuraea gerenzanensis]
MLLVEDEHPLARYIEAGLRKHGFASGCGRRVARHRISRRPSTSSPGAARLSGGRRLARLPGC